MSTNSVEIRYRQIHHYGRGSAKPSKKKGTYIHHLSDAHEMPRQFGADQAWVVGQRDDAFIAISSGELFGEENVTLNGLVSMQTLVQNKLWTVRGMCSWVACSEREEEEEGW
jgi:hypothetical protein